MKSNSKKLLMVILTIIAISLMLSTKVFADNAIIISNATGTTNDATNTTNIVSATNTTTILPTTTNTTVANTVSTSTYNTTSDEASLPKTGETDIYVVSALIVACGIFAVYAYKKVCDYKNM